MLIVKKYKINGELSFTDVVTDYESEGMILHIFNKEGLAKPDEIDEHHDEFVDNWNVRHLNYGKMYGNGDDCDFVAICCKQGRNTDATHCQKASGEVIGYKLIHYIPEEMMAIIINLPTKRLIRVTVL